MNRVARISLGLSLGALCVGLLGYGVGLRINTTNSIEPGLYVLTNKPVSRGSFVLVCPPNTLVFQEAKARGYVGPGFCPGNMGYLMKQVVAVPGDTVEINDAGVRINSLELPRSKPLQKDVAGRVLPILSMTVSLGSTQLFLMATNSPKSFDGRYFGPVDRAQVQSVINPVFTW